MSTYKDTDLESLIEEMRQSQTSDEALHILLSKKTKKELDKIYDLCDSYIYNYDKLYEKGRLK